MAFCVSCVLLPRSLFQLTVTVLVFGCLLSSGFARMNEKDSVTVAKCRASCIKTFLLWPVSDNKCLESPECYMCWDMCERVAIQYDAWSPVCTSSDVCGKGCKLACDFLEKDTGNYVAHGKPWEFLDDTQVIPLNDDALEVVWSPPVPEMEENKMADKFIVYCLLYRFDTSPEWLSASMVLNTATRVDGPHKTFPGLSFRLLAVNEDGVLAEAKPVYETEEFIPVVARTVPPTTTTTVTTRPPTTPTTTATTTTTTSAAVSLVKQAIRINAQVEQSNGILQATISWHLPQGGDYECAVTWRRMTCSVSDAFPGCQEDDTQQTAVVNTRPDQATLVFRIPFVTYNSHYDVKLNCDDLFTGETNLLTIGCANPLDKSLTQCLESQEEPAGISEEGEVNWFLIMTCLAIGILLFLVSFSVFYIVYKKCSPCQVVSAGKWEGQQLQAKYLEHRLSLASLPTMNTQIANTPQGLAQMNLLMRHLQAQSYEQSSMMGSQYGLNHDMSFEYSPSPSPRQVPRCGLAASMHHLPTASPSAQHKKMSRSMYSLNRVATPDTMPRPCFSSSTHHLVPPGKAVPSHDVYTDDDAASVTDTLIHVPTVPVYKRSMSDVGQVSERVQVHHASDYKRSYSLPEQNQAFETSQLRFLECSDMEDNFEV